MTGDFKTKQFIAGSCYSYILSSQQEAMIIDAHISLENEYEIYLNKNHLKLKYIIDTHTHADHFSLAAILKKKFAVPVLMYEKAISEVADKRLKDSEEIALGAERFKVIHTPGHTDDAMSIYGKGMVFTADVLLIGSIGRTDFQNGSPESMFDALQRLKNLPDETIVFPGHDYHERRSSTIGGEKQTNPFLKETNKDSFVRNMRSKQLPKPFNIDNIIRVNQKGEAVVLEMVSAKDAYNLALKDSGLKLIDVRSALEFAQVRIKDSINVPIDMLKSRVDELSKSGNKYVVLCRTGTRSPMAADMLIQSGLYGVKVMQGGITAWQKAHLPVIKGEGGISIERQVRIIAGSMVLFGILMSWLVHWALIFISVFVGCGLIYAGLTDNCLTGILLMNLPYNKKLYKTKLGGGTCSINGGN